MCLIGVLDRGEGRYILFKNRDLEAQPDLPEPLVIGGSSATGYRRVVFPTTKDPTNTAIWGGVNKFGLSMQFADIYFGESHRSSNNKLEEQRNIVRHLHTEILADSKSALEAVNKMVETCVDPHGGGFDQMVLIVDPDTAVILESSTFGVAIEWLNEAKFLLRTHMPRLLGAFAPSSTDSPLCLSALTRYQRAMDLIGSNSAHWDVDFVKLLLSDNYYNDTDFSISRSGRMGIYKTSSSLIVESSSYGYHLHYVLNDRPTPEIFVQLEFK